MKIISIYKSFESELILEIDTVNNGKFQFSNYFKTLHSGNYCKSDNIITDPNMIRNLKIALDEFLREKRNEIIGAEEVLASV